jgi:hypothetical protein
VSADRARTVPDTFQTAADALYVVWVKMLIEGAIKPAVRPTRQFISEQLCSQRKAETITPAQIDIVLHGWFEQAKSAGIIRENLNPSEVMAIRMQERKAGRLVNVTRLHDELVEIEIIHPDKIIDITPERRYLS